MDEEPAQRIVLTSVVKTALVAGQVHDGTEVLEGQILGRLVQRLDEPSRWGVAAPGVE